MDGWGCCLEDGVLDFSLLFHGRVGGCFFVGGLSLGLVSVGLLGAPLLICLDL